MFSIYNLEESLHLFVLAIPMIAAFIIAGKIYSQLFNPLEQKKEGELYKDTYIRRTGGGLVILILGNSALIAPSVSVLGIYYAPEAIQLYIATVASMFAGLAFEYLNRNVWSEK